MDSVLKSEQAMNVLSTITLAQFLVILILIIGIGIFIFKFKDRIKEFLEDYREKENKKDAYSQKINDYDTRIKKLEAHHEEDMKNMMDKQAQYRQQSMDKQKAIDNHFTSLEDKMDKMDDRFNEVLDSIQELKIQNQQLKAENDKVKCSELRDRLLQMHRYYTSTENNPKQEWSELEADTFWELFQDYEDRGGNGHMHSHVKPEMEKLNVIYF